MVVVVGTKKFHRRTRSSCRSKYGIDMVIQSYFVLFIFYSSINKIIKWDTFIIALNPDFPTAVGLENILMGTFLFRAFLQLSLRRTLRPSSEVSELSRFHSDLSCRAQYDNICCSAGQEDADEEDLDLQRPIHWDRQGGVYHHLWRSSGWLDVHQYHHHQLSCGGTLPQKYIWTRLNS